jgi:hypothetical protein
MNVVGSFKRNAKFFSTLGAIIVFGVLISKNYDEETRKDAEKIEAANTFYKQIVSRPDAQQLRDEFDSKITGKGPSKTPAEEVVRLGLLNRNDQLIGTGLLALKEVSVTLEGFDTAKIDDEYRICGHAQADYEDILIVFHGDTSNPPTDPATIAKINELSNKLRKESKELVDDFPQIDKEVLDHMEEVLHKDRRKLRLSKYFGWTLSIFGFVLNIAAISVGIKPAEPGE